MTAEFSWLEAVRSILEPPENLTVSEWADKYRVLDARTSKEPGLWRTDRTPYLRQIMDSVNDFEVEEIVVCAGAQVGKTEVLFNALGWAIHQTPFPIMLVYPTQDVAESVSRNRILPMIEKSRALKNLVSERAADLTMLEMKFKTTTVYFAWSNSPSVLSSKPICYLFLDEIDKYPAFSGKEADPIALAKKRTTTFRGLRKILYVSTPTLETGNIWKQLQSTNVIYKYAVPCPKCGHKQFLEFENIKWPEGERDPEVIRDTAYYECEKCGHHILDSDKDEILAKGEWVPWKVKTNKRRKIGFHLSALYSPFVSWGEIAAEFIEAKDDPAKLMDFVNSRLAMPWAETVEKKREGDILKLKTDFEPGVIPKDTVALTMGIDTQKDGFYYVVHAWANDYTTLLTRYGYTTDYKEILKVVFESRYRIVGTDVSMPIVRAFWDSGGHRTDEIYEICRTEGRGIIFPIKGMSVNSSIPIKESILDKYPGTNKPILGGLKLISINTTYYKEAIHRKMQVEEGLRGRWNVHKDIAEDYIMQMTAEEKRRVKKGNRYEERWVQIRRDNHYLDCSVYAFAAADHVGVRYLEPVIAEEKAETKVAERVRKRKPRKSSWIAGGGGWL